VNENIMALIIRLVYCGC